MAEPEGKLVRRTDIPISVGKPSAETAKKWLRQQVPYRNFAGMHDGLDTIAAAFVHNHREQFRSRMGDTMRRWATNWAAANGESVWAEHADDVHVPETKKAIDAKVARVEEALLEFDPIFEVEGTRNDLPRYKAQLIGAYSYRQMELADFRDYVQPAARDAELCNLTAIKVCWEHLVENIVERKIELKFRKDGTPYYEDERRMREAIARSGVRYNLVDPFWFFYDLDAARPQECSFIGDESFVFMHDLERQARMGMFSEKQVKLVKDRRAGTTGARSTDNTARADMPDQYRKSRSIALGPDFSADVRGEHGAARVRCTECWAWFDFGNGWDGVVDPLGQKLTGVHRVVITLANGVCVRFQLNPFDRKFVPYAVARINRNGHEMVAPSQFDHVVQMNAQYDRVHSNILRMLDLSVAPLILTGADSDLPDNILGVLPGSVLRNAGQWEVVKMPDVAPNTIGYYHHYFRNEIEESSGALRVFESPQGTATETERKVQEQQRMVRNSIRANGELWRQVALLTYWMSAQFSTQPERFGVIGKAATVLGKTATMTPDILQEDVDFKFVGLQSLHTYGSRLSGMRQWMNNWGPMLSAIPGANIAAIARMDFELSVGRSNINEVFSDAVPVWDTMPQAEENVMLLAGHQVPISKQDDDWKHIEDLKPLLTDPKIPAYIKGLVVEHLNEHLLAAARKEEEARAQQQQAAEQAAAMAPAGGEPGVDRPPAPGGMPAQSKGVTPGPTQARTVAKTGRSGNGTSQQQAMSA